MANKYENDFKVMIVDLLNTGRSVKEVSDEYSLDASMLRRWRKQFDLKSGDFSKPRQVSADELELKALKKELRDITMERDILKKAVSIFSKSDK